MADSVQSALQLLQSGGSQPSVQAPSPDPVSSALSLLQKGGQEQAPPMKIGAEGMPDAIKAVAGNFSPLSQLAVGFSGGIYNMGERLKQLVTGNTPTAEAQGNIQANRALTQASLPAMAGQIGSEIAATNGPASAVFKGAEVLAKGAPLLARVLGPTIASGIVGAAAPAATQTVLPGESTAQNAGAGAVGGIAADALFRGAGRVAQPIMQSAPVRKLMSSGVVPTIGQALGGVGNSIEQRLSSIPGIGDVIRGGQRRAVKELNRAAIQEVAPDVKAIGREGLRQAESSVSNLYDKALSNITVKADESLVPHLQTFADNKTYMMTPAQRQSVKDTIDAVVGGNVEGSSIPGEVAKKIDSDLGAKAASMQSSAMASEREAGKALQDAQTAFRQQMAKGASTQEASDMLNEANAKYAKLVRLQRATASGKEGEFTPGQLQAAVKQSDRSIRKNQFAKGKALMQDLSEPAVSVLGDRYPDSGTVGRYLLSAAALGGAGANEYFGGPQYLTGMALAPLLYSRAGSRYMLGDLAPTLQPALAAALRGAAPYAAQAGALYQR